MLEGRTRELSDIAKVFGEACIVSGIVELSISKQVIATLELALEKSNEAELVVGAQGGRQRFRDA